MIKKFIALTALSLSFLTPFYAYAKDDNSDDTLKIRVPAIYDEEKPSGENKQPEWTTKRRFATTRVYVEEPYEVEFEQWLKGKFNRDHTRSDLFQTEVSIGLPHRFQLDLYENMERNDAGTTRHAGNQVEVRHALAEWGQIPLNPTVYAEWKFNDCDADAYELKVLLAEEIAPGWHWGFNAFYEQQIGDERQAEAGLAQAVSYTLLDKNLSLGLEMNVERTSHPNFEGIPELEVLVGPSLQWRILPRLHVDVVPLIGMTPDAPRVEAFVIFGFDLYKPSDAENYAPVSLRSK